MSRWRWYSKLLFAILVAAFAWYVWPTQWAYYRLDPSVAVGGASDQVVVEHSKVIRVNRFTGKVEEMSYDDPSGSGWRRYQLRSRRWREPSR